ncbi:MAG TPA: hypothetical protein VIV40_19860 [Kofleriaceae bacterium]
MRERSLDGRRDPQQGLGMAMEHLENDERQATLTMLLTAIMSVIITGLIVAAVLSTRACSV